MLRYLVLAVFTLGLMMVGKPCDARVDMAKYATGWTYADSVNMQRERKATMDSLAHVTVTGNTQIDYNIQKARKTRNRTLDFYLLVGLCFILGGIRYSDHRYFTLLMGAFTSPNSSRQWRELVQAANLSNLAMNLFFTIVAGSYIYYLSSGFTSKLLGYRAPLVMILLIFGMMVMYAGKYAVIRFTGWAFRVEELADEYLFNVFLINKIIGIVLLPFVVVIAFAGKEWTEPMAVVSGCIAIGLLAMRYLRSWSAFYSFFKGSRFHFFTYLCASEILPMAVLVKWLLHLLR